KRLAGQLSSSRRKQLPSSQAKSLPSMAASWLVESINDGLLPDRGSRRTEAMKIVKASVNITSPGRNFVTLKIETDEGIYGLGDGTLNGRELAVASYLTEHVIPCIVGRDPFQTEDIWQYLYRGAYWRRGPVTMAAIGAVDVALWDIKGKALNTPVYN